MVNDHYPYYMAISLRIYPIFRQTHMALNESFGQSSTGCIATFVQNIGVHRPSLGFYTCFFCHKGRRSKIRSFKNDGTPTWMVNGKSYEHA